MKNPFARQREEGLQHAQESGEATVCTREGEGLQSAQERGRGYSLHNRGGGATVYLREEAGLKSSQKKGRGYSLHKRGGGATVWVCTCECLPREGGGVSNDYLGSLDPLHIISFLLCKCLMLQYLDWSGVH